MFNPLIVDNFATDTEISKIFEIYTNSQTDLEARRCLECNKPYMKYFDLDHPILYEWTRRIIDITGYNIKLCYKTLSVMVNTSMPYHADNSAPKDGNYVLGNPTNGLDNGLADISSLEWVSNHCPNRALTAVIYLNDVAIDDNNHGATVFPQHKLLIHSVSKRMSLFSCDNDSIHGVMNVGKNIRIAALLWFEKGA